MKRILKPAAWAFYFVIVFEILFMISPFAVHFYSAYGPALNLFHRWPSTAWLTQFFLPHFSQTDCAAISCDGEVWWPQLKQRTTGVASRVVISLGPRGPRFSLFCLSSL